MPSVTDSLSSLVGGNTALAASALAEPGGGASGVGSPGAAGSPVDAGAAGGSFADVLGRMQRLQAGDGAGSASAAELAQSAPGTESAGPGSGRSMALDAVAGGSGGEPAGRQEIAASFAIQWALLARGGQVPVASGAESAGASGAAASEDGETARRTLRAVESVESGQVAGWVGLSGMPGVSGLLGGTGSAGGIGAEGGPLAVASVTAVPPGVSGIVLDAAAGPGVPPVVAVPISPALSVLTMAGAADPQGEGALMEFARSQGFDPDALRLVFGAGAEPARLLVGSGSPSSPGSKEPALDVTGVAGAALSMGASAIEGATMQSAGGSAGQAGQAAGLASGVGATQQATGPAAGQVSASASGLSTALAAQAGAATSAGLTGQQTGQMANQMAASSAGASGVGFPGGSGGRRASGVGAERAGFTVERMTSASGVASAAAASGAVGAAVGREASAWVSGAQWAQAVGRLSSGVDAVAAGAAEAAELPLSALASGGSAAEAGSALPSASATGSTAPTSSIQAGAQTAARPELGPLDLRAHLDEQAEGLSRRMGEALAQRVMSQIDSGQWQIRLSVMPEQLGPIDIDLQVTGQRVEAQFQVANAQTQTLIQDSVPRLKDIVGSSGMDLASVWVSGGWSERNRGNPTPGQPDEPASAAASGGADDGETGAVSGVDAVERSRSTWTPGQGALDILI